MTDFDLNNDGENKRYDDVFLGILQKEEKIDKFLDCVFNFLCRRTDFFLIQETPDLPYGFPPNVAKHMVHKIFSKYDSVPKEKLKKMLLDSNESLKKSSSQAKKSEQSKANPPKEKSEENSSVEVKSKESSSSQLDLKTKQEIFQNDPSSYNGAKLEKYSWTQTIKEIDVRVKIGPAIKSSKDVRIKIQKEDLQVSVKTGKDESSWVNVISDKLSWKVKPEESTWSLFPGDHIHIYLEKVQERWWERLLESEEKLDLKNMNPEKPMDELDEESQAKIKQLMYDEQQKRLGLPTSDEQKNIDMLKKAWDAEGSPFKGQPFDPSVLKMN